MKSADTPERRRGSQKSFFREIRQTTFAAKLDCWILVFGPRAKGKGVDYEDLVDSGNQDAKHRKPEHSNERNAELKQELLVAQAQLKSLNGMSGSKVDDTKAALKREVDEINSAISGMKPLKMQLSAMRKRKTHWMKRMRPCD